MSLLINFFVLFAQMVLMVLCLLNIRNSRISEVRSRLMLSAINSRGNFEAKMKIMDRVPYLKMLLYWRWLFKPVMAGTFYTKSEIAYIMGMISTPGDTIVETMRAKRIFPKQLAETLNKDLDFIHRLLEGREPLTDEIAQKLEESLGIDKQFWINREKLYRDTINELTNKNATVNN